MDYQYLKEFEGYPFPGNEMGRKIMSQPMPLMEQETPLAAKEVSERFREDHDGMDKAWFGLRQTVEGIIGWKGIDIHDLPAMQLTDAEDSFCYVQCVLKDMAELDAAEVGDHVIMEGNYLECHPQFGVVLKQSAVKQHIRK